MMLFALIWGNEHVAQSSNLPNSAMIESWSTIALAKGVTNGQLYRDSGCWRDIITAR